MRWLTFFSVLALVVPSLGWAQSQKTISKIQRHSGETHQEVQLIRCDSSSSITGNSPLGGESCTAGDWSIAMDCRDATNISIRYHEYSAAGSSVAKIWDCLSIPGPVSTPSTLGGTVPGTEAPGATPSAADPDPLCVDITAAASVTMNGTTTQLFNLSNQKLHFIVGEIDACTNCDSTLVGSCGR